MSEDALVSELKAEISRVRGWPTSLKPKVATAALKVLQQKPQTLRMIEFKGKDFLNTLVSVWILIRSHKDKDEMTKRIAEEVAEGVGMCAGGRVGRLINSLRGFVDIGGQVVNEEASGELMQAAFVSRALKDGLTPAQRRAEAEKVLNEFGVIGEKRQDWLQSLQDHDG